MGFSVLWGAVLGVAISQSARELAAFAVCGMLLTVLLTVLLYRQQSALQSLAETDSLTGVTNHRGFQQALRGELRRAAVKRETLCLVVIDLDDFKTVNEHHGHPFGDGVLQRVGAKLRKSVRRGHIADRTRGDQFA